MRIDKRLVGNIEKLSDGSFCLKCSHHCDFRVKIYMADKPESGQCFLNWAKSKESSWDIGDTGIAGDECPLVKSEDFLSRAKRHFSWIATSVAIDISDEADK